MIINSILIVIFFGMTYLSSVFLSNNKRNGIITIPLMGLASLFILNLPFIITTPNYIAFAVIFTLSIAFILGFIIFQNRKKEISWQPSKSWMIFVCANVISIIFSLNTAQRINGVTYYWSLANSIHNGWSIKSFEWVYLFSAWNSFAGTLPNYSAQFMYMVTGIIVINSIIIWSMQKLLEVTLEGKTIAQTIILFIAVILFQLVIFQTGFSGLEDLASIAIVMLLLALFKSRELEKPQVGFVATLAMSAFSFSAMLVGFGIMLFLSFYYFVVKKIDIYKVIPFFPLFVTLFLVGATVNSSGFPLPIEVTRTLFALSIILLGTVFTPFNLELGINVSKHKTRMLPKKVIYKYIIISMVVIGTALVLLIFLTIYTADTKDPLYQAITSSRTTVTGISTKHNNSKLHISTFQFVDILKKCLFIIHIPSQEIALTVALNMILWTTFAAFVMFAQKGRYAFFITSAFFMGVLISVLTMVTGKEYITPRIVQGIKSTLIISLPIFIIAHVVENFKKNFSVLPTLVLTAVPFGNVSIGNMAIMNLTTSAPHRIISHNNYLLLNKFEKVRDKSINSIYSDIAPTQLSGYGNFEGQDDMRLIYWVDGYYAYNWAVKMDKNRSEYLRDEHTIDVIKKTYIFNSDSYNKDWHYLILKNETVKLMENKYPNFSQKYKLIKGLTNKEITIYERK